MKVISISDIAKKPSILDNLDDIAQIVNKKTHTKSKGSLSLPKISPTSNNSSKSSNTANGRRRTGGWENSRMKMICSKRSGKR